MATARLDFGAQIRNWANLTDAKMEAVFKKSAELLEEEIKRNTPVDTGNLVASFITLVNDIPKIDPEQDGKKKRAPATPSAIPNAKIGDFIGMGFTANYARYVEYGTSHQPAVGMVRRAAQRFPQIVQQAVSMADRTTR